MQTIYKYPLALKDKQRVVMHEGATVFHVDVQNEQLTIWAMVDTNQPMEDRHFYIVGTGHPMPNGPVKHVGTALMQHDRFVWHVFEGIKLNA